MRRWAALRQTPLAKQTAVTLEALDRREFALPLDSEPGDSLNCQAKHACAIGRARCLQNGHAHWTS